MTRPWDAYLSPQDREHDAAYPSKRIGFGERAALVLIDNYRGVLGDEPEPLLESVKKWPMSTGPAGWTAVERIRELLGVARAHGLPVVHATALASEFSVEMGASMGSVERRRRNRDADLDAETRERQARQWDLLEGLTPVAGEVLIEKAAPSVFFGTPLVSHLQTLAVDTLIVAGESTSGCVRATVVDGASYRYRMIVPEECVYDRHEAPHAINLFDMDRKYADVMPLAEVVDWVRAR